MTNKQAFAKAEVRRRFALGELRSLGDALECYHRYLTKSKDELPRRGILGEEWAALQTIDSNPSRLFYSDARRRPYHKNSLL